jgi:hypothetical protein
MSLNLSWNLDLAQKYKSIYKYDAGFNFGGKHYFQLKQYKCQPVYCKATVL